MCARVTVCKSKVTQNILVPFSETNSHSVAENEVSSFK